MSKMQASQRFRVSFRREILILLPVALLLPVLLSTFALFSYRNALRGWLGERQEEALDSATRVAESLSLAGPPSSRELRLGAPRAQWAAVLDASGSPRIEIGGAPVSESLATDLSSILEPTVLEGDEALPGLVAAIAPAAWGARSYYVVVGMAGDSLDRQRGSLRVLSWVVLTINGAVAVLVILFLRHVLAPYDTLLARARQALPSEEDPEDEVGFLVASFERGLEALQHGAEPDDVDTVERLLGPSLASGLLLIGRNSEVLSLNQVGADLLGIGVPPSGTPLQTVLAPHPELYQAVAAAIADEQPIRRAQIEIRTGGEPRTLGLGLHPLRRDGGPPRAFLVLFADLTESSLRAREETLATSLAHVGEMAAGVAHEMRNSLATIRGYLTLAERGPDDESLTDYLADLRRESDHLQRVLDDFLTFARPGSTRMEMLDLASVARRAAVDPAFSGLRIEVAAEPGSGIIQGDRQLLERAVRNLLENAAQAQLGTGVDQPLEVDLGLDGDRVRLRISDRGPGIPEELRDRVFQPFVTGRDDGVGLGLSLAHRIVALHGGSLRLEDRPGGGTRAVVSLPVAEPGQVQPAAQ